jgi:hypothetical protein
MNLKILLAGAAMALATGVAASANAAAGGLVNGDFETGNTAGWTGGFASTNEYGYLPTDGQYLGSTYAGCGAYTACTFSQTFTTTGGKLSGDAAFLAHDYNPFNDWGFVNLFDGVNTTTLFYSNVATVGDFGSSGWTHFTDHLNAGTYTITVGAANWGDNAYSSQIIVDHFTVPGAPEPAEWALMLTGFFGAGVALRATRRKAVAAA